MDAIVGGIDVSKDKLDIAVRPRGEVFTASRDAAGLDAVIARLCAIVSGGGRGRSHRRLRDGGCGEPRGGGAARCRGKPGPGPVLCALGKRAKTDPIDAMVIAHFAEAAKPDIRPLPDEAARLLSDLVARRRQIIQMIVAERQRQRRMVERRLRKSIARLLKALEKELSSLDQSIDDAVRGSPAWRAKEDLLPRCRVSGR